MRSIALIELGIILVLTLTLWLTENERDKYKNDLITITEKSIQLERDIEKHNENIEAERQRNRSKLEAADAQRLSDIDSIRADFIAEQLRLSASNQGCREENASLSRTNSNHERSAAEKDRLLLRTLDEAEAINAAYQSCTDLIEANNR